MHIFTIFFKDTKNIKNIEIDVNGAQLTAEQNKISISFLYQFFSGTCVILKLFGAKWDEKKFKR